MTGDAWLDDPRTPPLLRGLVRNPGVPAELLLELLAARPEKICEGLLRRADLPDTVAAAMLRHPSARVRGALAAHPAVAPQTRAALLRDPEWRVSGRAYGRPGQRPLSDDALVRLLGDLDDPTREIPVTPGEEFDELFHSMRYERRLTRLAAAHPRPGVRRMALRWAGTLPAGVVRALAHDPDPPVRQAATEYLEHEARVMTPADLPYRHCHALWATLQRRLSRELIDHVLAGDDPAAVPFVAANPSTPPDVVDALLDHPVPKVRHSLAGRADLTDAQLARLAADPAVEVRTAVSVHPGLTEEQRAGIDIDVATAAEDGWSPASGHRGDARSVNPLLRRRAAHDPHLPPAAVALLAADPDLGVRVRLALHHPGAPPELLLRCYLEYTGRDRDRLVELPGFPSAGLARLAGHADPAVRRLVALDPHAAPGLVDRLTRDPDAGVRAAMAACARLPVPRILELLDDAGLREAAAGHPALPEGRMRRITAGYVRSAAGYVPVRA